MDSARSASGDPLQRAGIQKEVRQILAALPSDVQAELNAGTIDVHDPAFLDGLADHISRLAVARPSEGRKWLGKLSRLKTLIRRSLREEDPEIRTATTIRSELPHVGRNEPCPCGSGRKYKQCCMRA